MPLVPLKGTTGVDTLEGSKQADTIIGRAGDDVISGFGGDDTIDGGSGNDTIDGDQGTDRLAGGLGHDILRGGEGNDFIYGDHEIAVQTTERLHWITQGQGLGLTAAGFSQDAGLIEVSVSHVDQERSTGAFIGRAWQYFGEDETFDPTSSVELSGSGNGPISTTTFTFGSAGQDAEVSQVRFRINDLDGLSEGWQDIATLRAFALDGTEVALSLRADGNDSVSGQTVTASLHTVIRIRLPDRPWSR